MGRNVKVISKSRILGVDLLIFVTLGTQDKSFERLLKAIQKVIDYGELKNEKIIVQAGHTKFQSNEMEIFDLVDADSFQRYINECDLLITHGGVGSITSGLKKGKKVIAAARLEKYKEHTNDHQLQIIDVFSKAGYILPLDDFEKLDDVLKQAKTFKPKKFKSNTNNFLNRLEKCIEENN